MVYVYRLWHSQLKWMHFCSVECKRYPTRRQPNHHMLAEVHHDFVEYESLTATMQVTGGREQCEQCTYLKSKRVYGLESMKGCLLSRIDSINCLGRSSG